MITREHCQLTRTFARDAFLDARGDRRMAIRLAKARVREGFKSVLVSILIAVLVRLAVYFILKWIEEKLAIPPYEYQPNELGFNGLSDDDTSKLPEEDASDE